MKTDSLFYRLFKDYPQLVLDLLELNYSGKNYRFSSEEIKQTAFRHDGIFMPLTDNPEQPLIFVEVQFQADVDFYDRLFTEITLFLRHKKPNHCWQALVIYPSRAIERAANRGFLPFMDLPQLHVVYLEDYLHQNHLTPAMELARLLICNKKQTIALAQKLVCDTDNKVSPDMLNFIETVLAYKLPDLSREEVKKMLALDKLELKNSRFYQEVLAEGREEGREKGRDEGERIMLLKMLERKFGLLPEAIKERIANAHSAQLEQWMFMALEAPTLDEIFD